MQRRSRTSNNSRRRPTATAIARTDFVADVGKLLDDLSLDFTEWALRIPTAKGAALDFGRFPYQREIYRVFGDLETEDADVVKSVQVGMSELLARLTLYVAAVHGLTALYVFPALRQMLDFSVARVDRLIDGSPYLQSLADRNGDGTWNKGLKRIGGGFIYYRGSEAKNDLVAIDADLVALDEYDQLKPENIPEAEARIAGSTVGVIRRVGIPSDPEYGIWKRYLSSDMRRWLVKCRRCKARWQEIDFWKNLDWDESNGSIENPRVVCALCRKPLDVLKGEWVPEYPQRARPGFHVHRLMRPGVRNLQAVIEASKRTEPSLVKKFWNNDLALPFTDEASGLDRTAIGAAVSKAESHFGQPLTMQQGYSGQNVVTMGVDVASVRALNVRISEHLDPPSRRSRKRALWIGKVDSFEALATLMDRYSVDFAVIDHLPEGRLARAFADLYPGRVYVCHYSSQQREEFAVDVSAREVSVQRVPALDATVNMVLALRNLPPSDLPQEYIAHMTTPRRTVLKDEFDRVTVQWQERGPTDYFHAEVYDLIATEVVKFRVEYDKLVREEWWQLDDVLDFQRSRVNDPYDMTYRPGPEEPDFDAENRDDTDWWEWG